MTDPILAKIVGVDVGGTFTDFIFVGNGGEVVLRKRPTTPNDPSIAVILGLTEAIDDGILDSGFTISHGTTVATNALLERKGARTALVTTSGFRDVLEIGRQARPRIYSLEPKSPEPLIALDWRFEVDERLDSLGEVIRPLDEGELRSVLEKTTLAGIESLAICFLFAHLNPEHESRAADIAEDYGVLVSRSSGIAAESREYERTSTVAANAYVLPVLQRYLGCLDQAVKSIGGRRLRVMQSNGGALAASAASSQAIKTVLSGPAGGVIAAARIAKDAGLNRVLTFDMGGTSTDVGRIVDGECPVVTLSYVGDIPLRTPMLDIHTVGAGGGSQAWIDSAGALRVGPQSAGAHPGPAAYGISEILTVTDANVFLGRLPGDLKLAGTLHLDVDRVVKCFAHFARKLRRSPEDAALGIVSIAEAAMARALRHISIERGHDPADFALLSFGGAGGLHACALAKALGIREVVVPFCPGALSALGLAIAPIMHELVRAVPTVGIGAAPDPTAWRMLQERIEDLRLEAGRIAESEGCDGLEFNAAYLLDLRYVGQSYELRVPFDPADIAASVPLFHNMHLERFGHSDTKEPVEAVAVRCTLYGAAPLPTLKFAAAVSAGHPTGQARLHDGTNWIQANRYNRDDLACGQSIESGSVVLQADAATFIPRDWNAKVDRCGNLRLTLATNAGTSRTKFND